MVPLIIDDGIKFIYAGLVYIPGGTHCTAHGGGPAYSIQSRIDDFVEHLMGYAPPADALISSH